MTLRFSEEWRYNSNMQIREYIYGYRIGYLICDIGDMLHIGLQYPDERTCKAAGVRGGLGADGCGLRVDETHGSFNTYTYSSIGTTVPIHLISRAIF